MRSPKPGSPVFAPLRHWLLLVVLLAVIAGATAVLFGRDIHDLYVSEFVAPELERDLGFRIAKVKVTNTTGEHEVHGIVAVDPDGVFARAGFRPGDIPIGYVHGFVGFYHHLDGARGKQATIRVLRPEAMDATKARQVTVTVPAGR